MNAGVITVLLFSAGFVTLISGMPIAFGLGAIGTLFTLILWGPTGLFQVVTSSWSSMNNFLLVAVPLFVLMANVLTTSGVSEDIYKVMHQWVGRLRGGLEIGTIIICAIFAAMSGISAVGTVTMGVLALPEMLKRNHSKTLALGSVAAGGALGILIPPSVIMVVYGGVTELSVGKLFMGGVLPGILLSALFICFTGVICFFRPSMSPPIPRSETLPFKKRLLLLKGLIFPLLLIILVLGVIYAGIATPTEAAGIGAVGAIACSVINRRFTWKNINDSAQSTLRITCMVMWIMIGASIFTHLYEGVGATKLIERLILGLEVNRWVIMFIMQAILFVFGMFLDPVGILMITIPIFHPLILQLGFDPLWFGILFVMNMEMAYLTPPFGYNLFYLKAVAPDNVAMLDIYKGVVPFIALQAVGLIITAIFPEIALWLPATMVK